MPEEIPTFCDTQCLRHLEAYGKLWETKLIISDKKSEAHNLLLKFTINLIITIRFTDDLIIVTYYTSPFQLITR